MLKKLCSCGKVIDAQLRHCPQCQEKYNQLHNKQDSRQVYRDPMWLKISALCKQKFNGLDIHAYYVQGKIVTGKISHHIVEVSDDKSRVYDLSNLIYLSQESHALIHKLYRESTQKKIETQKLLLELIARWGKEMS